MGRVENLIAADRYLFVDDTVIFFGMEENQLLAVKMVLFCFGLKINAKEVSSCQWGQFICGFVGFIMEVCFWRYIGEAWNAFRSLIFLCGLSL